MSILASPLHKSPELALTLQKYLLLHSQHDALQKHLDDLSELGSSSKPLSTASSFSWSTPSAGSTRREDSLSWSTKSHLEFQPKSDSEHSFPHPSYPPLIKQHLFSFSSIAAEKSVAGCDDMAAAIIKRGQLRAIEGEELKLACVNQQIKCALTELLNCADVRVDGPYRKWCLTRLMEAEMELKGRRARARRGGSVACF